LYDSAAMRGFVDIDLGREPAPDETTICYKQRLQSVPLNRLMRLS
jgi:IS5 family transposase